MLLGTLLFSLVGFFVRSLVGLVGALVGLVASLVGLVASLVGLVGSLVGLVGSLVGLVGSLVGLVGSLVGLVGSLVVSLVGSLFHLNCRAGAEMFSDVNTSWMLFLIGNLVGTEQTKVRSK